MIFFAPLERIFGLFLRQVYLIRRSPPRVISYAFWPTMDMMVWGFLNKYLYKDQKMLAFSMSVFLGARLLYSFSERSQVQIMWCFLEDVWAKNLGNILISPIRSIELVAGFIINGLVSTILGMACAYTAAFFIFDYTLINIGVSVLPMLLILMLNSWWIGLLLITLVLRYGPSGEHFGWMASFVILPVIAVFYPVSVLPQALQHVAWALPPTYVFEGLRELVATGSLTHTVLLKGVLLACGYVAISIMLFMQQLNAARRRGGLLSMSE
jgi:ABC-2 type transport system permease protein